MKDNLLLSVFIAFLSYSITTLINLLTGNPLKEVLYNGLIALFIAAIITFLITYILDNYQTNKNSKKEMAGDNNKSKNNKSNKENNEKNNIEKQNKEAEEFSPMDPTVLEVEEEESN